MIMFRYNVYLTSGVCFNCSKMDLKREMSFIFFEFFGLNSHNRQIFSHSPPGCVSSRSFTNAASEALQVQEKHFRNCIFFYHETIEKNIKFSFEDLMYKIFSSVANVAYYHNLISLSSRLSGI